MKFGVRECVDVVFRAKSNQKVGNKIFYKHEPVIYFDTLKTSSLEGAATTVYATGGRGNPRLISWDGERTVTFTMEDALISPEGLSILSGAGLLEAGLDEEGKGHTVIQHLTERTVAEADGAIYVTEKPYANGNEDLIYVMILDDNGEIKTEPILYTGADSETSGKGYKLTRKNAGYEVDTEHTVANGDVVLVDYYTEHTTDAFEINITPDKFGGAFYMEASTLWRNQADQKDYPAEFIIPNLRVQSNFTFTMASSGDPSSFTFTCDAFPDYTRFDKTKKVLAQIQVVGLNLKNENVATRHKSASEDTVDVNENIIETDKPVG